MDSAAFLVLAQLTAIVAIVVTATILTVGCMSLITTLSTTLMKRSVAGETVFASEEAENLRERLERFPQKMRIFYAISVMALLFLILSYALVFEAPFSLPLVAVFRAVVMNPITTAIIVTILGVYGMFVGLNAFKYEVAFQRVVQS